MDIGKKTVKWVAKPHLGDFFCTPSYGQFWRGRYRASEVRFSIFGLFLFDFPRTNEQETLQAMSMTDRFLSHAVG